MPNSPVSVVEELIDRITVIATKTYEVEQLLPQAKAEGKRISFRRVDHAIHSAEFSDRDGELQVEFFCHLTLQAHDHDGRLLAHSYLVKVRGNAGCENRVWRLDDVTDVTADPIDLGDYSSGFSPL